jgi:hypothetical protein
VEVTGSDKHSKINYGRKRFIVQAIDKAPGNATPAMRITERGRQEVDLWCQCNKKLSSLPLMLRKNKLKCLSVASIYRLGLHMQVRQKVKP